MSGPVDVMARAPRRSDRAVGVDEAAAVLAEGLYGVLSTVGPDGLPYGVPLSYIVRDDAIYFHCANAGRKLEHLDARPEVSFCVVGKVRTLPRQFATEYESVIVSGRASRVEGEEKRQALVGILEKYSPGFMSEGQKYLTAKVDAVTVVRIDIDAMSGKARR